MTCCMFGRSNERRKIMIPVAVLTSDLFVGLDPHSGHYRQFPNKAAWLNYLLILDRWQAAAREEAIIFGNPWAVEVARQERRIK